MRILHLAAGAGNMRCGACARDLLLVRGLLARGHEVRIMPLYTPLRSDAKSPLPMTPIFFGGLNVYLEQSSSLFSHTPEPVGRLLDHPALLKFISRFAVQTDPAQLGPLTVSMLAGEHGRQQREIRRLLRYIDEHGRPEVVSITNSLLSGIAPSLKQHLGCPIFCSLQGEDTFIAALPPEHGESALTLIRENAALIDLFISPGEGYAQRMADWLAVAPEKIRVIRAGIDPRPYGPPAPLPRDPFTVGYLSAITPAKGLDILIDAIRILIRQQNRTLRLRIAGQTLAKDYWKALRAASASAGLDSSIEFVGEVDPAGKLEFLRSCTLFCMPSRQPESRAMAAMEAMAAGRPVLAPDSGIFPELISLTGGGLLFTPQDPASLAERIAHLMDHPAECDTLAASARENIARHFSADEMCRRMEQECERLVSRP